MVWKYNGLKRTRKARSRVTNDEEGQWWPFFCSVEEENQPCMDWRTINDILKVMKYVILTILNMKWKKQWMILMWCLDSRSDYSVLRLLKYEDSENIINDQPMWLFLMTNTNYY